MLTKHFKPFMGFAKSAPNKMASILLNRVGQFRPTDFHSKYIWNRSSVRLCVDGAANDLCEEIRNGARLEKPRIPTMICGDMDSISDEAKAFFIDQGVEINSFVIQLRNGYNKRTVIPLENQNYTDFEKTLMLLKSDKVLSNDLNCVYIIGLLAKRFDHTLNIVHALHLHSFEFSCPIYFLTDTDIVFMIKDGDENEVDASDCHQCGNYCGVVPMLGKTVVSSRGLKYEMHKSELEFGVGMVSTANGFKDNLDKRFRVLVDKPSLVIVNHTFSYGD